MSDTPDLTPVYIQHLKNLSEHFKTEAKRARADSRARAHLLNLHADRIQEALAALATERARADKAEAERDALAGKLAWALDSLGVICVSTTKVVKVADARAVARATIAELTGGGND